MPDVEIQIVDAFTWEAYAGNSAGVVLDADGLVDAQMVAIAREVNCAETAFVTKPTTRDAAARIRWFTPAREVEFCGHATLAAVHALLESGRFTNLMREPGAVLPLETLHRGIVPVRTERQRDISQPYLIWFDAPDPRSQPAPTSPQKIIGLLGTDPSVLDPGIPMIMSIERDLILGVKEYSDLMRLAPRMNELAEFCVRHRFRGVLVTTRQALSPAIACHSRFFAPAFGIPEDPVTGSAHGPLAVHLIKCGVRTLVDGKAGFDCLQSQAGVRGGVVRVVVSQRGPDDWHVRVGGACVTTIRGSLAVLPKAE